jgi:sporulation protein YlmC with PRC-barrel domain
MRSNSKAIIGGLLTAALLSTAAYTQTAPSAQKLAPQTQNAPVKKHNGDYRASKLIGVNVYNRQNEKIGDINEVLIGKSGSVSGVVVGVGGFLGMGEHDVLVKLDQIKFVNEPVSSAAATTSRKPAAAKPAPGNTAASTTPANPVPANTTGTGAATSAPAADRRAANTADRPARAANEKWYPDHAVMNATKDQLKAMPAFKYSDYN